MCYGHRDCLYIAALTSVSSHVRSKHDLGLTNDACCCESFEWMVGYPPELPWKTANHRM